MNKNSSFLKIITMLLAIITVVGSIIFVTNRSEQQSRKEKSTVLTEEQAVQKLEDIVKDISAEKMQERQADLTNYQRLDVTEELPSIESSPLVVEGNGDINIEIFSSPEKAGNDSKNTLESDRWMTRAAERFNSEKYTIEDQTISISIRKIDSGLGKDYIVSQKYWPQAYSPSNELWGEVIASSGVPITLKESRLVGNVPGILMTQKAADRIQNSYGEITFKTIVQSVIDGKLVMGYTDPFKSSCSFNFLGCALEVLDSSNPLSDSAIKGFTKFQKNIKTNVETTMTLRNLMTNNTLEAIVIESQSWNNIPELKDYVFIPYGIRHDEPIYAIGNLSSEQNQVLDQFIAYCKSDTLQKLATEYGFNTLDHYVSQSFSLSGSELKEVQQIWKKNKDTTPVIAVFVADISGSMEDRGRMANLKTSLINASTYINQNNYVGLITFNSRVYLNVPIRQFNEEQRSVFIGSVKSLYGDGTTASYNAILYGLNMLVEQKELHPDAKLKLFYLSDGNCNRGYTIEEVRPVLENIGIPIYCIGYEPEEAIKDITDINESSPINGDSVNTTTDDVAYKLKSLFNSQM